MQLFDLSLISTIGANLGRLPPAPQPYGFFNKGDVFLFNGQHLSIERVAHAIIANGPDTLSRTLLTLGAVTANLPPDAHSFPQVASGSGNGGGWVVGNG